MRNPVQALFFGWTSQLTRYFPRTGARLLDFFIRPIAGSRLLSVLFSGMNRKRLGKVRSFRRILVHPDIHIGDAIMAQSVVTALRDCFPDAEVDLVVNRSVSPLIEGNPEINRMFPIYSGGSFPPESELEAVGRLMGERKYDLCINISPFLAGNKLAKKIQPVFDFMSHAPTITRNESTTSQINHIVFQYQKFIYGIFEHMAQPRRETPFHGVTVRLSDFAFEEADRFLTGFGAGGPLAMMNADTASPYTRIPFPNQVELVTSLLQKNISILIGAGHTEAGIGKRLIEAIPTDLRHRVRLVPAETSLETFSALGDRCDLFITGDTGPMHIAAARKVSRSGKYQPRNRTAVLCLFGATPARLSGYDSFQPGYFPANQDAPSWTVVAESPCRNITCVNKLFKTCEIPRCFEKLDVEKVGELLTSHLTERLGSTVPFMRQEISGQIDGGSDHATDFTQDR